MRRIGITIILSFTAGLGVSACDDGEEGFDNLRAAECKEGQIALKEQTSTAYANSELSFDHFTEPTPQPDPDEIEQPEEGGIVLPAPVYLIDGCELTCQCQFQYTAVCDVGELQDGIPASGSMLYDHSMMRWNITTEAECRAAVNDAQAKSDCDALCEGETEPTLTYACCVGEPEQESDPTPPTGSGSGQGGPPAPIPTEPGNPWLPPPSTGSGQG